MLVFILRKKGVLLNALFLGNLKFISVILIIALFSELGVTQTYEKIFRTTQDDFAIDAIELPDQSIIYIVNSGNFYSSNYSGKLFKVSSSGLLIDSIVITIPNGYNLNRLSNIFSLNDSIYVTTGECTNIADNTQRILIFTFDQELSIINDTLTDFFVPSDYYFTYHTLNSSNRIVTIGTELTNYNHFIYEYDLNGSLFNSKILIDTTFSVTYAAAIKEIEETNKYHFFIFGFPQNFWIIDKESFETDTILNYPGTFLPFDAHCNFNNNSYLAIGRNYIGNGIYTPAFLQMDNMGNVLNMHSYTANPDTNSGNIEKSLDIYDDKIFLVAAYNFLVTGSYPFVNQQQWLWLNRINDDYSVSWQRFYKGEVNYMPYKVLATSDGGALILSTKYDWNDSIPLQRDVHILKVDSTGWYEGLQTGITEYDKPKQILVYPNPVKDKVIFVLGLYDNLNLSIYNSNGQCVIREKLLHSQTINMSHLPNGLYVYIIIGKDGFFEKGRLIKQ